MAPAAPLGLSAVAAARIRRITVITVAALAVSAAVLSFAGLLQLAEQAGFPSQMAWLFPLMIDGMVLTGSLGVIASTLAGVSTWYMWMLTLFGVAASIAGNVAAAPPTLVSQLVHAAPPLVFALSIEGLLRVYRAQAHTRVDQADEMPADEVPTDEVPTDEVPTSSKPSTIPVASVSPAPAPSAPETALRPARSPAQTTAPARDVSAPAAGALPTARERLRELLRTDPDISGGDAARRLGIDPSHARKLLRAERGDPGPGPEREPVYSGPQVEPRLTTGPWPDETASQPQETGPYQGPGTD
jgi:hypothetical protein